MDLQAVDLLAKLCGMFSSLVRGRPPPQGPIPQSPPASTAGLAEIDRETAPHEYTVRTWMPDEPDSTDFNRFVTLIRRFGYADFYYQVRHLYWAVDGFKYWTMGWPVPETVVVNRARVDAAEPWREQSGPRVKGRTRDEQ